MRRIVVGAVAALLVMGAMPVVASAGSGGGGSSDKALINGFVRDLITMAEDDQWFFDDGCIGGEHKGEPLNVVVPATDPATLESSCSVRKGAPVVISAAAFSCWQVKLKDARKECETAWADPAQILLEAAVTVDGKPQRLHEFRVSGCLTFPKGAVLDTPGLTTNYFSINRGVVLRGLKKGADQIVVSFSYADGFAGATTFTIDVTN